MKSIFFNFITNDIMICYMENHVYVYVFEEYPEFFSNFRRYTLNYFLDSEKLFFKLLTKKYL